MTHRYWTGKRPRPILDVCPRFFLEGNRVLGNFLYGFLIVTGCGGHLMSVGAHGTAVMDSRCFVRGCTTDRLHQSSACGSAVSRVDIHVF